MKYKREPAEERLIRLREVGRLLALNTDTGHTCNLAAKAGLTVVYTSHPWADRVTIRLVFSEVLEWGKKLGALKGEVATVRVKLPSDLAGEERLIPLAVGAIILGVSPDAIRKREAPAGVEQLTIIDIARSGRQRRSLRLVYSEVVILRDRLIQTARERMDVGRMIERRD